jgi:metal-sulfur cluster biosynthetic enzyme
MQPESSGELAAVEDVEEAMRDVVDPELGINVVDLDWSTTSASTRAISPPST